MEENINKEWEQEPLFVKATDIMDLSNKLIDVIQLDLEEEMTENNNKFVKLVALDIAENSMIIPAKIVGAMSVDLYHIKMENATLIKVAAEKIQVNCTSLLDFTYGYNEYLQVLKEEIEDFRILFAEWVKTFDKESYTIDRWGLFNPPGINYDDNDADDC
jgi:hypothetical protein